MNRSTHRMASLLACLCVWHPARAALLPTDLQGEIGANYRPRDADEERIWRHLERLEAVVRDSPQRLVAPDLESYTRSVLERLLGRAAPEFRIYLMRDASFNAAMFPSGMLILNTGLLPRIRSEAQFAAVLGHEIGHYYRRHSLERYRELQQKSATAELTSAAATTNAGGPYAAQPWIQITRVATLSYFRFSRNQESEADAYGLMLMARAGYPPRAAQEICRQLIDERKASAAARGHRHVEGADAALSTHPPTERRIADLADTASWWLRHGAPAADGDGQDAWPVVVRPHLEMLLHEQVYLNDPGASLYLLEGMARRGWTSLLRSSEGDVYTLRAAPGDAARATAAYAAAALPDAAADTARARRAVPPSTPRVAETSPEDRAEAIDGVAVSVSRMTVRRDKGWRNLPASERQSRWEDVWTWTGGQIDRLTLVGGLPAGGALGSRDRNARQRVPAVRAGMTARDLAAMLEVSYRVNGVSLFVFDSVEPMSFLGGPGLRMSYHYASGLGNAKLGRCVMRIVEGRLYLIKLEGVAHRSFELAAAEFERLVSGARLNGTGA